jgi:predicted dehydrogenase
LVGDDVVATFGFDGVTGTFESARIADGGGSDYFHLELCGTAGILAFWSDFGKPVLYYPRPFVVPGAADAWQPLQSDPPPAPLGAPPNASAYFPTNQALVRDLLEAVEEDRAPLSDGHDARAALEMIVAVYESHMRGTRVPLPLADRIHPLTRWK